MEGWKVVRFVNSQRMEKKTLKARVEIMSIFRTVHPFIIINPSALLIYTI